MMKGPLPLLLTVVLALLLAAVAWLVLDHSGNAAAGQAPAPADDAAYEQRLQQLQEQVNRQDTELQRLRQSLELMLSQARQARPAAILPPSAPPAGSAEGDHDPRWYLEQYVLSFQDGGGGSEYFRLAVEAYAGVLLDDIAALVLDPSSHRLLRLNLLHMLGQPRFQGDERVVAVLLQALSFGSDHDLLASALLVLGVVGPGTSAAAGLEAQVWTLPSAELQQSACALLMQLSGPAANRALLRLLASAPDTNLRAFLVTLVQADDLAAALQVFRYASGLEQPVRLAGAQIIGNYRSPDIAAFVDEWRSFETDPEVREALGAAREQLNTVPSWDAFQMVGPPDADPGNDNPKAWASSGADMGQQWIQLGYAPPRRANGVRIYQVNIGGAVIQVEGIDEQGNRHVLWRGDQPDTRPGMFEVTFPLTDYRIAAVRILLDTDRGHGWNEIDAVELVGPDGSSWASDAAASSTYGAGGRRGQVLTEDNFGTLLFR